MDKSIKQELLAEIGRSESFTFVDLIYFFENRDVHPYGDYIVGHPDLNIYMWIDLSEEVANLIMEMLHNEEIFAFSVDQQVYASMGAGVCAPMAKRLTPGGGYKRPHWQPVIFRTKGERV